MRQESNGNTKSTQGECNKDEKDKDKEGKDQDFAKVTEYFAEHYFLCKVWAHEEGLLVDQQRQDRKRHLVMETPITQAATTATEPPKT